MTTIPEFLKIPEIIYKDLVEGYYKTVLKIKVEYDKLEDALENSCEKYGLITYDRSVLIRIKRKLKNIKKFYVTDSSQIIFIKGNTIHHFNWSGSHHCDAAAICEFWDIDGQKVLTVSDYLYDPAKLRKTNFLWTVDNFTT